MIEIKKARNVPGFRFCPVCRTRLAPKGSNVRVNTTPKTKPAELAEVGIWAEETR